MSNLLQLFFLGTQNVLTVSAILWIVAGTSLGLMVGAIPGFSAAMATGILLPFTYAMSPRIAMIFLISIYISAIYGGSITAILLNTPGAPESSATAFDGYEMTQQGKGCEALGISFISSAIGGLISYVVMFFIMKPLAVFALKFGPLELFLVAMMGVSVLATLAIESPSKTFLAGFFGLLLGSIGIVPSGEWRATFGSLYLAEGIQIVPAIIGFFAMSEIFSMVERETVIKSGINVERSVKRIFAGMKEALRSYVTIIKSAVYGIVIGAIPAAGATVAAFVSYGEAKRSSKHPEKFGKGYAEGIVAAESANNASTGGALITTLALGVPGSSTCAVLLGALLIQGLRPGPQLLREQIDIVYIIIVAAIFSQVIMVLMATYLGYSFTFLLNVSTKILAPALFFFCVAGSFAVRNAVFDVWMMFFFGLLGWLMKKIDFSLPAVVLGIVLGGIADSELMRAHMLYGNALFIKLFTRPISVALLLLILGGFYFRFTNKSKQHD